MAIYRKINTTFWSDPFICDLPTDKKLFYLYLLTNERTKQCGIYDISKRQISFDLGIDIKTVTTNLVFFQNKGKLMFSDDTNEIALKNWNRFNGSTSPKVVTCVNSELKLVKNRVLIQYVNSMHTPSQQTEAPTQEETPTETPTETQEEYNTNVSAELKIPPPPKIDFDKLVLFFNNNRGLLPEVKKLTPARKKRMESIVKQYGKELIQIVIEKSRDSDFIQGRNKNNWMGTFDWIFKPENFIKIAEDNYINKNNGQQQSNGRISNEQRLADIFTGGKYDHLI